jgi:hypothetical protein
VRTRLAKSKLSTTPYDVERACAEFNFIDKEFVPQGTRVDKEDYEGGLPGDKSIPTISHPASAMSGNPGLLDTGVPAASKSATLTPLANATNALRIKLPAPSQATTSATQNGLDASHDALQKIHGKGFVLCLSLAEKPNRTDAGAEISDEEEDGKSDQRTFCPVAHRETIVNMMERHYCAHPLIPGYAAPYRVSIKHWAVQQMYHFCERNDLREVWAYLWENWYRRGRWELWARSEHDTIPVLKTTMILESQ